MSRISLKIIVATFAVLAAGTASAACTLPTGVEGETLYNTDYATMQFCDGTNWISMAASGSITAEVDPQVGTLTGSHWCKANAGATAIDCGVTSINLATDITGNLPGGSLPSLASTNIWVGNGSNVATAVAMSGDVMITNAGVTTIGAGAVTIAKLAATGTASTTTFLRGDGSWATPSSSQWTNGAGGAISYSGGNVGIGSATPSAALDVVGNMVATGTVTGAPPTAAGHLTTKAYVDAAVAGASGGGGGALKVYDYNDIAIGYFVATGTGGYLAFVPIGPTKKITGYNGSVPTSTNLPAINAAPATASHPYNYQSSVLFSGANCTGTPYLYPVGGNIYGYGCTGAGSCSTNPVVAKDPAQYTSRAFASCRDENGVCNNGPTCPSLGASPLITYETVPYTIGYYVGTYCYPSASVGTPVVYGCYIAP